MPPKGSKTAPRRLQVATEPPKDATQKPKSFQKPEENQCFSLLYGSGCWTMTVERANQLQTAERRMLRKIVPTQRMHHELADMSIEPEPWVDWIARATHRAENIFRRAGHRSWVDQQQCRKLALTEKTANRTDGRWSTKLLNWTLEDTRLPGRPCKRFSD